MITLNLDQIRQILPSIDLLTEIENGFQAYSNGQAVVPPIGEMILKKGEVHIKYGFIEGDPYYVIKIASGFYENPDLDLPSGNGLMLLFSQETGELLCTLHDEGHLTNIRTAVAGAITARYLAPSIVHKIGIVGAGTQGRLQLRFLRDVVNCDRVLVWGVDDDELAIYKNEMEPEGYHIESTRETSEIMEQCNLIVTTTPTVLPILKYSDQLKGTHITAMGSDTTEKQELDPEILSQADLVVADSIDQCLLRGEIFQAINAGQLAKEEIVELGQVISGSVTGRRSDDEITVADLTGVAVQDIKIASAVYEAYMKH